MKRRAHIERDAPDDSLAVVAEQDRLLIDIFNGWDATTPPPDVDDTATIVCSAYQRGTYGKLLIERAALRVAAKTDVARVLYDIGSGDLADDLVRHLPEVRRLCDRLDELARGVDAMGVAASIEFAGAVGNLAAVMRADLDTEPPRVLPRVEAALGSHRTDLHDDRWVRHHAPTHPGARRRWYSRIPVLVRIQSRYDRLRGFPWAHSAPMSGPKVADSLETES
ncbi:MAG: hypothetical protein ACR2KC_07920 [Acidimicrobiales bacterium]